MSGYDEAVSYANLLECAEKSVNGSRWKPSVQVFNLHLSTSVQKIHDKAIHEGYKPSRTNNFTICERGKVRRIKAHPIEDRAFYKSWVKYDLLPHVQSKILESNTASQKGKGTDQAIQHFKRELEKAVRKWGSNFYVITTDYHDYFGSLPHDKILEMLRFEDPRSQKVLEDYLKLFPGGKGIGIGGEPSQVTAIVYTSIVDRTILCNSPATASGRYMDDSWAICHTKEEANQVLDTFIKKSKEFGLQMNEKRTQIYHMTTDTVIWLKKRTHIDKKTKKVIMQLTRKNVRDCIRRIHFYKKQTDKKLMPKRIAFESIQCWAVYAKRYNANKQLARVLNEFGNVFDVKWEIMRKLRNKKTDGWINECKAAGYFD